MFEDYLAVDRSSRAADDYIRSMDKPQKDSAEPRSNEAPAKPAPSDRNTHDAHGTPFERVPGPGPNDQGKGAAGREALDRVERNH
ncbi:MAG TPA: hypothetical protein VHM31_04930 [Polyangia bacterium]|nr:hypothetical protein [Polyangia bacterium]